MASTAQTDASIRDITRIGLGCSRLGSIGAQDSTPPEKLLQTAAEVGITFYDTADIYAQGDSERHIGKFLRSSNGSFVICTKVGQYFPWYFKPAFLLKGTIKSLLRRAGGASAVRTVRARILPQDFSGDYVERNFRESLARLQTDSVDILLLHSPSADVLRRKDAVSTLQAIKRRGAAKRIGAACDDVEALEAALDDDRIDAVQVTLDVLDGVDAERLHKRRAAGLLVIAREIFGGARPPDSVPLSPEFVRDRLIFATSRPDVDVVLIGTANDSRLRRLINDYRASKRPASDVA
ncbi:aldo/keto reductase [Bradyrhizobium sp. 199]|uniref:aldo/keto reductase n=1 Tax=Bradyrhizobium sp. 199 TaxID=2782664 RepID=UPI001FFC28CD|nr:aldo/keto reductase [Bradyrhizobium sp. 199]MCK1362228.1 aldo/keto reductase [Bradyrhizobium sp. 199]